MPSPRQPVRLWQGPWGGGGRAQNETPPNPRNTLPHPPTPPHPPVGGAGSQPRVLGCGAELNTPACPASASSHRDSQGGSPATPRPRPRPSRPPPSHPPTLRLWPQTSLSQTPRRSPAPRRTPSHRPSAWTWAAAPRQCPAPPAPRPPRRSCTCCGPTCPPPLPPPTPPSGPRTAAARVPNGPLTTWR